MKQIKSAINIFIKAAAEEIEDEDNNSLFRINKLIERAKKLDL